MLNLVLFYNGAGPGLEAGYPIQVFDAQQGITQSYRPPPGSDYKFYRYSVHDNKYIAVKGFGNKQQQVILLDEHNKEKVIYDHQGVGVYFPLNAGDGKVAFFLNRSRLDMPPKGDTTSCLFVIAGDSDSEGSIKESAMSCLKEDLPLIPFDYSVVTKQYYYTILEDGKYFIEKSSVADAKKVKVVEGIYPRINQQGDMMAYINNKKVIIYDLANNRQVAETEFDRPISWLSWDPDNNGLAIGVEMAIYRTDVYVFKLDSKEKVKMMSTGILKDMNWIRKAPDWEKYIK